MGGGGGGGRAYYREFTVYQKPFLKLSILQMCLLSSYIKYTEIGKTFLTAKEGRIDRARINKTKSTIELITSKHR